MSTRAVGIDLGTTFSAIAHVNKHGVPEILHNGEGDRITPTVLLFEDQEVVVGNYAKQSAVVYLERVAGSSNAAWASATGALLMQERYSRADFVRRTRKAETRC